MVYSIMKLGKLKGHEKKYCKLQTCRSGLVLYTENFPFLGQSFTEWIDENATQFNSIKKIE
jgi:hypothetical protein